tara:strand:+ start:2104 stop:5778 length:3675 start_codon:yes stop_codon:yes gene_type:complete
MDTKFEYDPNIDYLAEYHLLPDNIYDVIVNYDEDMGYDGSNEALKELEPLGWTFEYGLGNDWYSLRPIDEDEQEFKDGGIVLNRWLAFDWGSPNYEFQSQEEVNKEVKRTWRSISRKNKKISGNANTRGYGISTLQMFKVNGKIIMPPKGYSPTDKEIDDAISSKRYDEAYWKNKSFKDGGNVKTDFEQLENEDLRKALLGFYTNFHNNHISNYLDIAKENYVIDSVNNKFILLRETPISKVEQERLKRFINPYFNKETKPLFAKYFDTYNVVDGQIIINLNDVYEGGGDIELLKIKNNKPLLNKIQATLNEWCRMYVVIGSNNPYAQETPRYSQIGYDHDTKKWKLYSTQKNLYYFIENLTNEEENFLMTMHYRYREGNNKLWNQYKEIRTEFLLEYFPTIDIYEGGGLLDKSEESDFNEWIEDGNAFEQSDNVWVEQTTQYRKKFTLNELKKFFKKEFRSDTYAEGGLVGKKYKEVLDRKVEPMHTPAKSRLDLKRYYEAKERLTDNEYTDSATGRRMATDKRISDQSFVSKIERDLEWINNDASLHLSSNGTIIAVEPYKYSKVSPKIALKTMQKSAIVRQDKKATKKANIQERKLISDAEREAKSDMSKPNRKFSDKYNEKRADALAKKEIKKHYYKGNPTDMDKMKFALPYDTDFDIEFEKGGKAKDKLSLIEVVKGDISDDDVNRLLIKIEEVQQIGEDTGWSEATFKQFNKLLQKAGRNDKYKRVWGEYQMVSDLTKYPILMQKALMIPLTKEQAQAWVDKLTRQYKGILSKSRHWRKVFERNDNKVKINWTDTERGHATCQDLQLFLGDMGDWRFGYTDRYSLELIMHEFAHLIDCDRLAKEGQGRNDPRGFVTYGRTDVHRFDFTELLDSILLKYQPYIDKMYDANVHKDTIVNAKGKIKQYFATKQVKNVERIVKEKEDFQKLLLADVWTDKYPITFTKDDLDIIYKVKQLGLSSPNYSYLQTEVVQTPLIDIDSNELSANGEILISFEVASAIMFMLYENDSSVSCIEELTYIVNNPPNTLPLIGIYPISNPIKDSGSFIYTYITHWAEYLTNVKSISLSNKDHKAIKLIGLKVAILKDNPYYPIYLTTSFLNWFVSKLKELGTKNFILEYPKMELEIAINGSKLLSILNNILITKRVTDNGLVIPTLVKQNDDNDDEDSGLHWLAKLLQKKAKEMHDRRNKKHRIEDAKPTPKTPKKIAKRKPKMVLKPKKK